MKWTVFIPHVVIFLSGALMLSCALAFKFLHKARSRHTPLQGRKVGNLPGQQVVARIIDHNQQLDSAISIMYMAFPLMFMVWLSFRADWDRVRLSPMDTMFVIGALIVFLWGLRDYIKHYRAREKYRDGWTAEHVTGLQLNRLIAHGCLVLHDLPAEVGNIDHVVISPRGVYAVETKSFRKPRDAGDARDGVGHQVHYDGSTLRFPDFTTSDPIKQAERQAQWLRRTLRDALQREVPVIPIVALPGWFVIRSEEGKRAHAQVFTPMGRGAEFMVWEPVRLGADERRVIAETLASRYPAIEDGSA